VAVGLLKEYWNLGIGTKMFEEMIRIAREREGVLQMELDFIEGNTRARALYEKMGFRITGVKPDAVRLKDGRLINAYMMLKKL
jgi:ribosomal protein S18 acetylase RimI-like enzyme